jgi:A/G-specific adenine glycosylase
VTLSAEIVLAWYDANARDLPWRRTHEPWPVVVSEVMLQQTPVARVLPVYDAWMRRWPTPAALAADSAGDAIRMWGRLGYPRRALRLHELSVVVTSRYEGEIPDRLEDLLALPGIGAYTARAIASFAFGQRHPVVDINVRRVVARCVDGHAHAGPPRERRDLDAMERLVPPDPEVASVFAVAVMELGAVVCTARSPRCGACPLAGGCAWQLAGSPAYDGPRVPTQAWVGTDRQARGALMAVLRAAESPVPARTLNNAWVDAVQRARALDGLVNDGLVAIAEEGFALPT